MHDPATRKKDGQHNGGEAQYTALSRIVATLEDGILFGTLRPREHLVEDALMARFGVKRHVVRQALAQLEGLGIVVRSPNKGATVRDFSVKEIEEIYEIREVLQARAAERMLLPVTPDVIAELTDIQRQHDAAAAERNLRRISQLNDRFHSVFYAACGNAHLADAINNYFYLMRAMRLYPIADPIILAKAQEDHWAMIRAVEAGDRNALIDLCVRHIQPSKRAYLSTQSWI
ncbi:MAG: GntR family transcriptional regulator [Burkholderiaceae bacterium]|nr:GntR family transcriptional regulator [Burkholderiaceae bacterium]